MIIGYGRTIWGNDLSHKKTNFSTDYFHRNGKRSLAPVVVVVVIVRLLLGGEDSRTRGERARFRVHGKGRHILTILLRNERRARKVTREISFHRLATALVLPLEYFFPFFFTRVVVELAKILLLKKNEW